MRGRIALVLVAAGMAALVATGCSPIYVIRAGIAEAKILAARQPIPEVILDPSTPVDVRDKLTLVSEARVFARDVLALDVGDSYTSFTQLEKDTLALVLSGARRDRFESKTWWFPIVGRVPYKGYFSESSALNAQRDLEEDGYDTYLRPTAAFSTLGWFADPLLSTLLGYDQVELVQTVLHELSHNHLFVGGNVRFNESFAVFVGRVASIEFFCTREGGGWDTVKCERAQARWRDAQRFSVFIDRLVDEVLAVYGDSNLVYEQKLEARQAVFDQSLEQFRNEVQPSFESLTFQSFLTVPLNNATLMARMRYYHRLADFDALYLRHGSSVQSAVAFITERVKEVEDPFEVLDPG